MSSISCICMMFLLIHCTIVHVYLNFMMSSSSSSSSRRSRRSRKRSSSSSSSGTRAHVCGVRCVKYTAGSASKFPLILLIFVFCATVMLRNSKEIQLYSATRGLPPLVRLHSHNDAEVSYYLSSMYAGDVSSACHQGVLLSPWIHKVPHTYILK